MPVTASHDQIVTSIIIAISEQSGEPATLESELDDLGLDSMDYCELALSLESNFSIGPIPDDDLFRLKTVDQVVVYVESWLKQQADAQVARETAEAKA